MFLEIYKIIMIFSGTSENSNKSEDTLFKVSPPKSLHFSFVNNELINNEIINLRNEEHIIHVLCSQ